MAFFENIEIQKLFCAEEADTFPPFTEKDLAETEKAFMGFPQTEKGLQIGMITGSTSGSIPTLAFHSGKHSRQGMTCILWITEPWTRTASLGLF